MADQLPDLEAVERAALEDMHRAASPEDREALGLATESVAGALASVAGLEPSLLVNRVLGLGFAREAPREAIGEIGGVYRRHGVGRYLVHRHPEARPRELSSWLQVAGFRPHRGWMKFVRGREAPPELSAAPRVERIGQEHSETFARIVADAFDLTDACVPWLGKLPGRDGWHVYMSFDETGTPAGTGAIYVRDGVAYFDFGATQPEARRRGSQGAILSRRLADALDLGCHTMVSMTGEAVPGDPQHSYRNLVRAGFREGYLRENLLRDS